MRIGTAPINWNNEDVPDYRPWVPFPTILDEIVRAGYTATEWSRSLPADPAVLGPALQARGLRLVAAFTALDLRAPDRWAAEIAGALARARFLQRMGAEYLIAADAGDEHRRAVAGRVTPADGLTEAQWASLVEGLHHLAREVRQLGLRLAFHNHVGTYIETAAETARLLDQTDPDLVGWCLDTGHLIYGGGDVLALLDRYGPRVVYVHLKDVDGAVLAQARAERWDFHTALRRYIFTFLGSGVLPLPALLARLRGLGYDGWVIVEQDTTPIDPTETARRNRAYLEGRLHPR